VNWANYKAAGDIIKAFQTNEPTEMLMWFDSALARDTFARQEIREQFTQRGQSILSSAEVPQEIKDTVSARVEEELLKQIAEKPGDARAHVFISSFYRATGQIDKAIEQLAIARSLSPNKQVIIFEQGFAELQKQDYEKALAFFKDAYDLGPELRDVRTNYAIAAIYADDTALFNELIATDAHKRALAQSQYAIQAVYQKKNYPLLIELLTYQMEAKPQDQQVRTSLAYVLNESGDAEGAIEVLNKAAEDIPAFKAQAQQFIAEIEKQQQAGVQVVE
jgi:thioredoxin-like negative regulator of GroEL